MKRMKKQILIFLSVIMGAAVVFTVFMRIGKEKAETEKNTAQNKIKNAESIQEDEFGQAYMEKYGIPKENFLDIMVEDSLVQAIDFNFINQLKYYTATPTYQAEKYLKEMKDILFPDNESCKLSVEDYEKISDGELKGWGNFYSYKDSSENDILSGSRYSISYYPNALIKKIKVTDKKEFVDNYIDRFHLGMWSGDKNWMKMEEKGNSFIGTLYVDGIKLDSELLFGNINKADEDGAYYTGGLDTEFKFDRDGSLSFISFMYSAELSEGMDLKRKYNSMNDIVDIIRKSHRKIGASTGTAYRFDEAYLVYSRGVCDNGTYLLTPWLVLTGEEGVYYPSEGKWKGFRSDRGVGINLNTGTCFF